MRGIDSHSSASFSTAPMTCRLSLRRRR